MSGEFTPPLDQAKSEAFAEQMLGVLNSGALSLMLSIGHKTGLFDTMSHLAPSTSEQIAAAAGLQERYVREWLAAMVTGRIIEYDAAQRTYRLPAEYAAWLTHDADDLITAFDSIHDQARPTQVLAAIAKALQPGGMFLMVDFAASSHLEENLDHPLAPFLYTISCNHCMTVSLAANGEGLGAMWGEQKARQMLSATGFTQLQVMQVEGDIFNNYFIASKS